MSKKKSKSKSNIKTYIGYIGALLGLAAVAMFFLAGVTLKNKLTGTINITGFQVAFGYATSTTVLGSVIKTTYSGFSFLALLAIVLPLAGAVLTALKGKLMNLIGIIAFIGGAVLCFMMVTAFTSVATNDGQVLIKLNEVSLGIGAILAGVFSIIGALCGGFKVFVK